MKMYLKGIGRDSVDYKCLFQDEVEWWVVEYTVMNFQFS